MRIALVLILVLSLVAGASAAPTKGVPRLVFPVVGPVTYQDDFGAPRAGGPHQGNDILAVKKSPAVAVEAGTIQFWTKSATAGCMLYLHGDSGTTYDYIHLNNDLTMGNDNRGTCVPGVAYAPGLKDGAHVAAGQLVGYVGDSGDANGVHAHLHFEVHPGGGAAVAPYPYLQKAQPLLFSAKPNEKVWLTLTGTIVATNPGSVTLQTTQVQVNAAQPIAVTRKIVLTLPAEPQVAVDLPGVHVGLDALVPGMTAVAYALPVKATLALQMGDATMTASQILLNS